MSRYEDIADDRSSQLSLIVTLDRFSRKMHPETTGRRRQPPTTTPTRLSRRRANIMMPVQDKCPPLRSQQSTGCCLSHLVRVHLFFIVISSLCISISQFSCQTTQTLVTNPNSAQEQLPTRQDDELAALGYDSHMPAASGQPTTTTRCNQHRNQHQHQHQHQASASMSGRSGQQRALREPATNGLHYNRKPTSDNANTLPNHVKHHQLNQQTARQQRQFSQTQARSAAMIDTPQGQHQQQQQQEEFSLNSLTSLGGNAQTNGQLLSDQQANATSYAMLASELAVRAQSGGQLESAGSAPASSTSTTASSSPTAGTSQGNPTPPTTSTMTTTEQAALPNTTPLLGSETISSPVAALQPPATTSSSLLGQTSRQASSQQEQQQTRQQGRRIEDSSKLAVERHSSNLSEEPLEQGSRSFNAKAAISSMPSSTSIITPLVGPSVAQHLANEQQQMTSSSPLSSSSSSSMVKPIYVVGNPIGDLDYSSTMYSEQLHQAGVRQKGQPDSSSSSSIRASAGQSAVSAAHPQRGEKKLDAAMSTTPTAMSQGEQQVTDDGRQPTNTTSSYAITEASHERPSQPTASNGNGDRMNGPALVYSGGHLVTGDQNNLALNGNNSTPTTPVANSSDLSQLASHSSANAQPALPAPSPRLIQGPELNSAAVLVNSPRRPSLPPPVNQANAASGLRSPLSPSGPLIGQPAAVPPAGNSLQPPANSNNQQQQQQPNFYQTSPPYAGSSHSFANGQLGNNGGANLNSLAPISSMLSNKQAFVLAAQQHHHQQQQQQQQQQHQAPPTPTHLSAIPSQFQLPIHQAQQSIQQQQPQASITNQQQAVGPSRRPLNITRVEHISAECSNDLIRAVIVFNGTFKGIIYSSGYVTDPTCLYVNGTGSTRYEFSIRLNQCGTLGRQELHQPTIPGEARRRDQVMWNTLSIQYNPVIEQEWDEHFRVSCEYGSDFWKTISFSPFNVETSTGSPVVFTINPPQCQMDVLLGHGMGPKIAVDGPVTVGDPLTLLIHMKSEKAGYDILVKNCVAHNGGKQRMQLIDSNGCVVNERFISPFRGTYNDNDLRHVTLYAYLKAFRFTGSPVLYLECEIHMCQSACPPQMCYWRRLSKRSVDNNDFEYTDDRASLTNLTANELANGANSTQQPIISDSLSLFKALQVRHEPVEPSKARLRAQQLQEIYAENDEAQLVCYRHAEVLVFMTTIGALLLLVLTVAITCCLRIRKMTRSQFKHSRLQHQHPGSMSSQSPSLLSIDDTYPRSTFSLGSAYSPGNNNRTNDGSGQFEGHSGASFLRRVAFADHSASMKPNRQQVPVTAANFRHKQQEQRRQQSPIKQHNNNDKMYPNSTGSTITSANIYSLDR